MDAETASVHPDRSLDDLAAAANRDRSAGAMGLLWSAAFSVGSWTLIGRGGARRFEPLTTNYENLLCALAFTSHDRAAAFAIDQGLDVDPGAGGGDALAEAAHQARPHGARADLLSMPVPAAVDLLDELRSVGVECVLVNEGTGPFIAPLSGLLKLFATHGSL